MSNGLVMLPFIGILPCCALLARARSFWQGIWLVGLLITLIR